MSLLRALAALWRVGEDQVQLYTSLSKPSLQTSPSEATIGRAVLPVLTTQAKQPSLTSATNSNKVQQSHMSSTPYLLKLYTVGLWRDTAAVEVHVSKLYLRISAAPDVCFSC